MLALAGVGVAVVDPGGSNEFPTVSNTGASFVLVLVPAPGDDCPNPTCDIALELAPF